MRRRENEKVEEFMNNRDQKKNRVGMSNEYVCYIYMCNVLIILNLINKRVKIQVEVDDGWHKWRRWKRKSEKV